MSRGIGQHSSQAPHTDNSPRLVSPTAASGHVVIPKQLPREESMKALLGITWRGRKLRNKWARYRPSHREITSISLQLKATPIKHLTSLVPPSLLEALAAWDKAGWHVCLAILLGHLQK